MPDDVIDKTAESVEPKGADATSGDKRTAADASKDAKKDDAQHKESGSSPKVEDILDRYGLETPDELDSFIGKLKDKTSKLGDEDIEDLLAIKKQMIKYQAEWAKQEELQRREKETPEETIARLEKALTEKDKEASKQAQAAREKAEANKLIKEFNSTVSREVKKLEVPKYAQGFLTKYYGVDNPMHDVDLTDATTIKKLVAQGASEFQKMRAAIIEDFKKGGGEVPRMTPSGDPAPTAPGKDNQIKSLKDAKKLAVLNLTEKLFKTR